MRIFEIKREIASHLKLQISIHLTDPYNDIPIAVVMLGNASTTAPEISALPVAAAEMSAEGQVDALPSEDASSIASEVISNPRPCRRRRGQRQTAEETEAVREAARIRMASFRVGKRLQCPHGIPC